MKKLSAPINKRARPSKTNTYYRSEQALERFKSTHFPEPTLRSRLSSVVRGMVSFAGIAFLVVLFAHDQIAEIVFPAFGCSIKGNISINSGAKIFHTRGQAYYAETRIRHIHGERWFCSEDAARAAGWRKAGI